MLAENEVNSTFDIAISINLITSLGEKGVLVSIQTNAIVALLGVVCGQSDSLRSFSVSVLNVDVVELVFSARLITVPVASSFAYPLRSEALCSMLTTLLVYEALFVV